jgi:predicted phage tail protein
VSRLFQGAGGGGSSGGSSSATNTPDSLRSQDTFETIIALGEGPWEGLQNNANSFYIGDTQLVASDGTPNFLNFTLNFFEGDDSPNYVITPALGGSSDSTSVGTALLYLDPCTRTTNGSTSDFDYIDLRLDIEALYLENSNGTFANTLTLRVLLKPTNCNNWVDFTQLAGMVAQFQYGSAQSATPRANGHGNLLSSVALQSRWDAAASALAISNFSIGGKTTSTYVRQMRFPILALDTSWDIQVTKLSVNSDGATIFTDTTWESFQQVQAGTYTFPDTVCVQLYGQASSQFSSMPDFSGIYKMAIVKVPTNYDPVARTYTGVWDGTFKMAWTDNPAWCTYDLVTNTRYGLSRYTPITMDKWSVYEAGQWCDGPLADGSARYTFNTIISDARSVQEQIKYMAGSFNAVFYTDQNGTAYLAVDKDEQAVALFTRENIIDDFNYSFTDIASQYNDITVTFINPDLDWNEDQRLISNDTLIAQNGRIHYDFIAVGCTDAAEAIRRATYKMITATTETMLVSFRTNRQAQGLKPFDVILIGDDDLGYGVTGRVSSFLGTTIYLRDPIYLEAGGQYGIQFNMPSGIVDMPLIATMTGYNYTLTSQYPLPPFTPEFAVFTVYEIGGTMGVSKPFRVLKITESDGSPDNFQIDCMEINRNKWYEADTLITLPTINYSTMQSPTFVPGATSVALSETFDWRSKTFYLIVEPVLDPTLYKYYSGDFQVWYRPTGMPGNGGYSQLALTNGNQVANVPPGVFDFKVLPISFLGNMAALTSVRTDTFTVLNPKDPPSDVTDFVASVTPQGINLTWRPVPDIDTNLYQLWYGPIFATATALATLSSTTYSTGIAPAGGITFWIQAVDYLGNTSVNAVSVVSAIPVPAQPTLSSQFVGANVVITWGNCQTGLTIDHYLVSVNGTLLGSTKSTVFSQAVISALDPSGTGNLAFSVTAVDVGGNAGTPGIENVSLDAPPPTTVSVLVNGNTIQLNWGTPSWKLPIVSYTIYKGPNFVGSTLIGSKTGTFTSFFEASVGNLTYWVVVVDSAGNSSLPASVSIFDGQAVAASSGRNTWGLLRDALGAAGL